MNSQTIIFLLITFSLELNFGFECPQEGLRFKGDILETIVGLPAGWRYWQHCSKLCLDNPDWYESIINNYYCIGNFHGLSTYTYTFKSVLNTFSTYKGLRLLTKILHF